MDDEESDRMDVVFLGRKLGTSSGWDEVDDWTLCFYDFESERPNILPSGQLLIIATVDGTVQVDLNKGDDTEIEPKEYDALDVLIFFPRVEKTLEAE